MAYISAIYLSSDTILYRPKTIATFLSFNRIIITIIILIIIIIIIIIIAIIYIIVYLINIAFFFINDSSQLMNYHLRSNV